jgi:putative ABC transport system permease protein
MNTVVLSWRYLMARPLATALNLLLLTLGLAAVSFVMLTRAQIERAFDRDLAGIDAVVGAKGSPLQLILSGVFHLDVPTGNIALADVQALEKDARVAQLIPMSLGDSYRGYRIVGTTPAYLDHYGAKIARGQPWDAAMQAVLGAGVAQRTGLAVGDKFSGSHGLGEGGPVHDDEPYRVSGVLAACGCVLDRLILTSTESVWQLHETSHALDEAERRLMQAEREITLALVRYHSPLAAVTFPRYVNASTPMQAAAPALEITRLLRMLGVGAEVLQGFGVVLLVTAGLSVFVAMWSAVRERRADLALLRMLGAPASRVAAVLLCEALWLALLASVLGLLLGQGLTALLGSLLAAENSLPLSGWLWVNSQLWVPVLALAVALLAAAVPTLQAYRTEAGLLLNER